MEKLYLEEGKSTETIAEELHTTIEHVRKAMEAYDIQFRPHGYCPTKLVPVASKEEIEQLYVKENRTVTEIAAKYQIAHSHIDSLLELYKIPAQSTRKFGRRHTIPKEQLAQLYVVEEKTIEQIAQRLNKPRHLVLEEIHRHRLCRINCRSKIHIYIDELADAPTTQPVLIFK